ncbi:MAG: ATP-binding protein [Acidimicrobiales bacterium]|nr:ATP-binding protein [Acidimicrobiales bacterium]
MTSTITIKDSLSQLRLPRALREFERQIGDPNIGELSFEERFSLLLDAEIVTRRSNRIERRVREARFKVKAYPNEIDFNTPRSIVRGQIENLLSSNFITVGTNVLMDGPTGIGKTFLACAIGMSSCYKGHSVKYFKLSQLQELIGISRLDGTYRQLSLKLKNTELLIIDDFGISPISLGASRELLDLLDERNGYHSTLIASQIPPASWHSLIEDQSVGDAIIDRLIHDSILISLEGESMRKTRANQRKKE